MSLKVTPVKIWRQQENITGVIGKKGIIETYTMVRVAPVGFSQYAPFPVIIVKLPSGKKLIGQLTEYHLEDLVVGKKVVAVLRRLRTERKKEAISYVIKFKPL